MADPAFGVVTFDSSRLLLFLSAVHHRHSRRYGEAHPEPTPPSSSPARPLSLYAIACRRFLDVQGEAAQPQSEIPSCNSNFRSAIPSFIVVLGAIGERCKEQVVSVEAPSAEERSEWWKVFYNGAGFRTFARVLVTDVATNWLACFPFSARKHVYDAVFVNGLATEVVQILVHCLQQSGSGYLDVNAVQSNMERCSPVILV